MAKREITGKKTVNFVICLAVVYFIAFLGSVFTSQGVKSDWYQAIKPLITPPNWVFPVVWNVLFFLIALSLYYAWEIKKERKNVILVFGINFVLNVLWSVFYFGMQNPLLAFVEIIVLWLSILAMIIVLRRISKTSSYLLIPYFLWVSFASVLTYLSIL